MPAEPRLSLVIPVYNEARVIQANLQTVLSYLQSQPYKSEVVVVDDGSTDNTAALVAPLAEAGTDGHTELRLIRNDHRGKAFAVRTGVLAARGQAVIFADADLATPVHQAGKLLDALSSGYDVAIGSREGYGARRIGEPWLRHFMGRVFNLIVRAVMLWGYQDTQCGFKGFTRAAARDIFASVRLYGPNAMLLKAPAVTGFDVELLYLAQRKGYRVAEVPVEWHYGPNTKVNPLRDSWRNLKDCLRVRYYALRGLYHE
jgi:glycosyltransferase involved in cell wall biosynthesis